MSLFPDYLVLAPHATCPAHDGASVRSNELTAGWLRAGRSVVMVSKYHTISSLDQLIVGGVPPRERSKKLSAFLALARGVSYNAGKHVTASWLRRARKEIERLNPRFVYIHFLWTLPSVWPLLQGRSVIVDTHNFDNEWFGNIERNSTNPLVRYLARMSAKYSLEALHTLRSSDAIVNVTDLDGDRYAGINPLPRSFVIPNGCNIRPRSSSPRYVGRKKLYFLGLLSAKMNYDALEYFADNIWPNIREYCEFYVIGKAPTLSMLDLCHHNGWTVHADVPGKELDVLLRSMHYAVMPFMYTAGSKSKMMDAAGRGIPILATSEGVKGYEGLPKEVYVLDSVQAWKNAVSRDFESVDSDSLLAFARNYDWNSLAVRTDQYLQGLDISVAKA